MGEGEDTTLGSGITLVSPTEPSFLAQQPLTRDLDGYELGRVLGQGGMGKVYAAGHRATGDIVALKLLNRYDQNTLNRFKVEYRKMAAVSHHNLVRLYEFRLDGEQPFITMELVRGEPFDKWVRRGLEKGQLPNLRRLYRAMRQLIRGLARLHREGCIHRDIKPSNVIVTVDGRVVILDFGLIHSADSEITQTGQILGSHRTMAPEQVKDSGVDKSADWYAVGVILFKCLTGEWPIDGLNPFAIMTAKCTGPAPEVSTKVFGLPEWLSQLCMRMLERDPLVRPREDELIAAFSQIPIQPTTDRGPKPFVGRDRELEILYSALNEVEAKGNPVVVRIVGASGLGKSTLVRAFLDQFAADATVVAFCGRCLPREWVPYKGIDGIVDALAARIRKMSQTEREALQLPPSSVLALARVFPALAHAWGTAAPISRPRPTESAQLRRSAVDALRAVIRQFGARQMLVLAIDDFQWADVDSVQVLQEVLQPPDSPQLLLIISHDEGSSGALGELDRYRTFAGISFDEIQFGPLSTRDATQLVETLTNGKNLTAEHREQILQQGKGNPLLLEQLVRPDVDATLDETADGLLVGRVLKLARDSRELLETIAVASGPVARTTLDRVAKGSVESTTSTLASLVASALITITPSSDTGEIVETAHDRVRELVLAELPPEELYRHHCELAEALEHEGAEPEAIAEHWEQGRRPEMATKWAEAAAHQAAAVLAFGRAAAAYRRALRVLGNLEIAPLDELRLALAEQLIALGDVKEAADLLLELSTRAEPERVAELRRQAAWLLVEDGRFDEARPLIDEQLEQVGETLPDQHGQLLFALVRNRAALALRGLEFDPLVAGETKPDADRLARVDALIAALAQYGYHAHDALITSVLRTRLLRCALEAGEPSRVAYALAHEGLITAASGDLERGDHLVARGLELLAAGSDPTLELRVRHLEAMLYFMTGRWPEASERIDELVTRTKHTASGWLRPQLMARRAQLWLVCGRFEELRQTLPRELAALRERGNIYNLARLVVVDVELCLCEGRIADADDRLNQFRHGWPATFHTFETAWLDMAAINVALFRGQTEHAQRLTEATLADARADQVDRIVMMRLYYANLQARVLGQALLGDPQNRALEKSLRQVARALQASGKPMFIGMAASSLALIHELDGEPRAAEQAWQTSLAAFEQCGMAARAAAVRLRISGGADMGQAYFERERVTGWRRFVEVFAPSAQTLAMTIEQHA